MSDPARCNMTAAGFARSTANAPQMRARGLAIYQQSRRRAPDGAPHRGVFVDYSTSGCFSSPSFDRNSGCCQGDGLKQRLSRWVRSAKSSHFSASSKSRPLSLMIEVRFAGSIELAALARYSLSFVMRKLRVEFPAVSKDVIVFLVAKT
jgi:hypothetical protein